MTRSALNIVMLGCLSWLGIGCLADATDPSVDPDVAIEALQSDEISQVNGVYNATVSLTGSGCPAGSYDVDFDGDKTYTINFDGDGAQVEPGVEKSEAECKVNIDYRSRAGIQFTFSSFTHNVFLDLDAGTQMRQIAKYKFPELPERIKLETTITGPFGPGPATFEDTTPGVEWTPCSRRDNLKVNTRLVVKNNATNDASGSAVYDSMKFTVNWRNCQL
jgi:Domain of unknown function (DUF4360)